MHICTLMYIATTVQAYLTQSSAQRTHEMMQDRSKIQSLLTTVVIFNNHG